MKIPQIREIFQQHCETCYISIQFWGDYFHYAIISYQCFHYFTPNLPQLVIAGWVIIKALTCTRYMLRNQKIINNNATTEAILHYEYFGYLSTFYSQYLCSFT